jgi:hypothetical protein
MSNFSKIIDSLSPYAEDVARAASEFGDDAVRSIMKATPAMRKRLAALAEKRIVSSVENMGKKVSNVAKRTQAPDEQNVRDAMQESNFKSLVNEFKRRVPARGMDHPDIQDLLTTRGTRDWEIDKLLNSDYSDPARTIADVAVRNKPAYDQAILDIVNNADGAAYDALSTAPRTAQQTIQGLLDRVANAREMAMPESAAIPNYLFGTMNLPATISQSNLSALLRMIGDAQ